MTQPSDGLPGRPAPEAGGERPAMPDASIRLLHGNTISNLLNSGKLPEAEALVRQLYADYPRWAYALTMRLLFDRMPPVEDQPSFEDDLQREVQIVRRDGADCVLLLFAGFDHRMGVSFSMMHRWFGKLPAHLIYLRDFRSLFYLGGLPSLGDDIGATVTALQDIATALSARRILCLGCSGGVYGSLNYGLALGAEAILALAGPIDLSPKFNVNLRSARRVAHLWQAMPQAPAIDLRQSYSTAEHPPRTLITFDPNNWDDRLHAECLAGLPNVRLDPVKAEGIHAIIAELITKGEFEARLDWLCGH